MRIIVCGGRSYSDRARVFAELDAVGRVEMMFHGGARGADALADEWAKARRVKHFAVPAKWSKYGKRAGPMRNQAMLGNNPDLVVAFPGGSGTADMVRRAKAAGVKVVEVSAALAVKEAGD